MTKTVKALKEEYPNEMCSGNAEPVKAEMTPLSVEKLKGGYNLLCSGNIRVVPLKLSGIIRDKIGKAKLKESNNKMKNPLRIKDYSGR